MNKNDAIKNIRESLKSLLRFSNEITEKKFGTLELTDGTKITTMGQDIEVGAEVYQLDDMGNQTPLSDGDYVLNDGRTFTVSGNVVEAIMDGDGVDPENPTETPTDVNQEKMDSNLPAGHDQAAAGQDQPDSMQIQHRLDDLEKAIEDIKSLLEKLTTVQNGVNEQMMSKIETFAKEPGAKPIKSIKKESFSYDKKNEKVEKLDELFDFVKNFNKDGKNNTNSLGTMNFSKLK